MQRITNKRVQHTITCGFIHSGNEWIPFNSVAVCVCVFVIFRKTWRSGRVLFKLLLLSLKRCFVEKTLKTYSYFSKCFSSTSFAIRCVSDSTLLLLSKWFVFIHRSYVTLLSFTQAKIHSKPECGFFVVLCVVCLFYSVPAFF